MIDFKEFVQRVEVLSKTVIEPEYDAELYASKLLELAGTLNINDPKLTAQFEVLEKRNTGYVTKSVIATQTCGMMLLAMSPGIKAGLHDHPNQSGFILCCEGKAIIRAFDFEKNDPILLRHVETAEIEPGECSFLTPNLRNVHSLTCPVRTRIVDIFTPPLRKDLGECCQGYELLEELKPGIFTARKTD